MEWETIQYYFYSGIIIFIILLLLFKLVKVDSPLKKIYFWIVWVLSTLVSGTAILIFVTIFFFTWLPEYPTSLFDSKLWLSEPRKRTEMIDNLVESKILDHKSKADIIQLLGQPLDSCSYFRPSGYDLIYNLGFERHPFGVDHEWLLIWLENDTVKEYKVKTD
jgi:hypothetical protein